MFLERAAVLLCAPLARPQLCPSTQHVLVGVDQGVIYKWNRFS